MFQFVKSTCTNCGNVGHTYRSCVSPITSYGGIIFRVNDLSWNQPTILISPSSITGFENFYSKIEVLLIQRRDSLGYVEILRGKYKETDIEYIRKQVHGMTDAERNKLLSRPFDELWSELWGYDTKSSSHYRNDKEVSRQKLQLLRDGFELESGQVFRLANLVEETSVHWDTPEWGFPKGRREPGEKDLACALREVEEETGILKEKIIVVQNLEPLSETFFGSNQVHYCHKYFTFYLPLDVEVKYDETNSHMKREIGNLQWFTLEQALQKIRSDNVEKREILLRMNTLLRNFCPVFHD
jgi:8-oxo-dGTP pyrophosphatase MutT (NUDIX family)